NCIKTVISLPSESVKGLRMQS
ncbi:TPA: NIPSNAP family protein, partial [Escherichia coli]|nr:NIPSNAP family protein [Escherichia coli]EFF4261852.1 NIPSNAP family protein [Escherichia coli]